MSNATPSSPSNSSTTGDSLPNTIVGRVGRIATHVRGIAFWCAVLLPVLFLSALQSGIVAADPVVIAGLLLFNVICVLLGHGYAR